MHFKGLLIFGLGFYGLLVAFPMDKHTFQQDIVSSIAHISTDLIFKTRILRLQYLEYRFISRKYLRYIESQNNEPFLNIQYNASLNLTDMLKDDYKILYEYYVLLEIIVMDVSEKRERRLRQSLDRYRIEVYQLLGRFEEAIYPSLLPLMNNTDISFPQLNFVFVRDLTFLSELKTYFRLIRKRYT